MFSPEHNDLLTSKSYFPPEHWDLQDTTFPPLMR